MSELILSLQLYLEECRGLLQLECIGEVLCCFDPHGLDTCNIP